MLWMVMYCYSQLSEFWLIFRFSCSKVCGCFKRPEGSGESSGIEYGGSYGGGGGGQTREANICTRCRVSGNIKKHLPDGSAACSKCGARKNVDHVVNIRD